MNASIRQWTEELSAGNALTRRDIDDLESHLRDSVENLYPAGLSEEEALMVSMHRIGKVLDWKT